MTRRTVQHLSSCRGTLPPCSPLEQAQENGDKTQQQEQHPRAGLIGTTQDVKALPGGLHMMASQEEGCQSRMSC